MYDGLCKKESNGCGGYEKACFRYDLVPAVSAWAEPAMPWAVGSGLLGGRGESLLAPDGTVTRAEAAALLMRAAGEGLQFPSF